MTLKNKFIQHIESHQGILKKIVFLYADNEHDRDDLKQEILSQAWMSYPRFRGDSKFSTWFYRVALNTAMMSLRKREKQQFFVSDGNPDAVSDSTLSYNEIMDWILHQLNAVEKSLLLLMIDGYQQKEIAELLGISDANTRIKIHRLRKKLKDHGITDFT